MWEIRETVFSNAEDIVNSERTETTVSTYNDLQEMRDAYSTAVKANQADDTVSNLVIQPDTLSWQDDTNGSYVVWEFRRVADDQA